MNALTYFNEIRHKTVPPWPQSTVVQVSLAKRDLMQTRNVMHSNYYLG